MVKFPPDFRSYVSVNVFIWALSSTNSKVID